jgi:hypothetical protein
MENLHANEEQSHAFKGTKPFALRNNFEGYEEPLNRLRRTNPYIARAELYKEEHLWLRGTIHNLNCGITWRQMMNIP